MKTINSIPRFLDHSEDVRILQQTLLDLGFNPGLADGIFGTNTKKALMNLQYSRDLNPDGIIGNKTMAALEFVLASQTREDGYVKLSWEYKVTDAKDWSTFVFKKIDSLFDKFSQCEDIVWFRPDYLSLSRQQQINVWGELISAICKFESGWKPWSYMIETTMKNNDPVTGKKVKSEGLMQLSYQDQPNYPKLTCRFDWEADKNKSDNDKTRTILDPYINLEFGIQILARQIERTKKIAIESGVYWAVIKLNGKYTHLPEIIKMVKALQF
ncbi:peptidoglycan-binding domain-containing protein [Chryseobacterium terrae]|uniref:Peptidoglycan-binding domain-containing protein n=1 Tax=Chryseobacterium terrae TaxID=3163299 RepID=A0ABW8Y8T2_9FLAO